MPLKRDRSMVDRVLSTYEDYHISRPLKCARSDGEVNKHAQSGTGTRATDRSTTSVPALPQLEDIGIVRNLSRPDSLDKALDVSSFVRENIFDPVPDQRAGMNSTRRAEVLNFQANIPALITGAHIHALAPSPSSAEREVASLVRCGRLRRVTIPLRGQGTSSVSELLIGTDELCRLLKRARVADEVRTRFEAWLSDNPFAQSLTSDALAVKHIAALMQAGFLTAAAGAGPSTGSAATHGAESSAAAKGSAMSLETIANAASGTAAAVGGAGGSLAHGGGGAAALQVRAASSDRTAAIYQIAVPNAGAYLKLLLAARAHLVELVRKSSRRELPLYLLKEYWDAGLSTVKQATTTTKGTTSITNNKNPFDHLPLLPGQTKKWKSFYGMRFEWAFEEAFGGGLVECFNTRSVGLGVRLT